MDIEEIIESLEEAYANDSSLEFINEAAKAPAKLAAMGSQELVPADKPERITEQDAREIAISVMRYCHENSNWYPDAWREERGRTLLNKLNAGREQVTEGEAPSHRLPNWSECNLRVSNSKWLKDNDRKPEHDSLIANPLHEFIYEYDDSDAYKSAWFMHRLDRLIDFVKSEQVPAVAVPDGWKLVPCDPTRDMISAFSIAATDVKTWRDAPEDQKIEAIIQIGKCWSAMLASAPSAPSHSQQSAVVASDTIISEIEYSLTAIHNETAMQVCCGRPGQECCGSPDADWPVWAVEVMTRLDAALKALLSASPAPDSEGE